jgi:hypothetical protein
MDIFVTLSKALGPVAAIAEGAGKVLGGLIIKAVDAVFNAAETPKEDNH